MKEKPELSSLLTAACLVIVLWGLSESKPFFLPLLIAGLLAFLMAPLHRFLLRRCKLPEFVALIVSAIAFVSPFLMLSFLLAKQGQGLIQDSPQLMLSARSRIQEFISTNPLVSRLGINTDFEISSLFERFSSRVGEGIGLVAGGLLAVLGMGSQALLIFVFALLFLASRTHLRRSAEHILAKHAKLHGEQLIDDSIDLVQKFLVARALIVLIIGAAATAVLWLFGVNYSAFLGTFIGVMTLVPAIGSILAIGVTTFVGILTGHNAGSVIAIIAVLFGLSAIENYVLTPKMVGNKLNLSALASFVGLFAGGLLWGVWGMLLSVPILGVLRIAFSAIPSLQPWGELLSDRVEAAKKSESDSKI